MMESVEGIEPSSSAWKAVALPLSYTDRPSDSANALIVTWYPARLSGCLASRQGNSSRASRTDHRRPRDRGGGVLPLNYRGVVPQGRFERPSLRVERAVGIKPTTSSLGTRRSIAELRTHEKVVTPGPRLTTR